jgi:hypothetical protein
VNVGEIAEKFIRAAEVERASHEHVGPAPLRAQQLPYVHDHVDKNGWGKSPLQRVIKKGRLIQGDWLDEKDDPLADERKAFWDRLGVTATAEELRELDALFGGKAFRRWCFQVEGIHPETGRRRKDRALARISAQMVRSDVQNSDIDGCGVLQSGPEISDVCDTFGEDAGKREGLNNWAAEDAFAPFLENVIHDFSWAAKRNERRRQREAAKRKKAA